MHRLAFIFSSELNFPDQKNVSIPPAVHSALVSVWEQGASSGVLQRHHQSAFRIDPLPNEFAARAVKAWPRLPTIALASAVPVGAWLVAV